jgi:hypothetical protein
VVERLTLKAPGLDAQGRITTREGGGLETAEFERVVAGNWLDASVTADRTRPGGAGRGADRRQP